ncbi:MAG: hypothetical protein IT379_30345 [Deltaproteobacteria bacterium]|nr:hypothetical protein [Deltaproteobacteria bacterium]
MKKRSRAQRVGEQGEALFAAAAVEHGLIPQKTTADYGLDYFCQVEGVPDARGVARITGGMIGVAVRSTNKPRPRVVLSRDDADFLLRCNFPVVLALVHVGPKVADPVSVRLLDDAFADVLLEFLATSNDEITVTPAQCAPASTLRDLANRVARPGWTEQLKLHVATRLAGRVLDGPRIECHRSTDGEWTLVETTDFLAQFLAPPEHIRAAVFGLPARMLGRLSALPLHPAVIEAATFLPHPVAIGGVIAAHDVTLHVRGPRGTASCAMEARAAGDYLGFSDPCGFSIRVSKATPHEGKMVHFIEAEPDPEDTTDPREHHDLLTFLAHCLPDQTWTVRDTPTPWPAGYGYPVGGDLLLFGFSRTTSSGPSARSHGPRARGAWRTRASPRCSTRSLSSPPGPTITPSSPSSASPSSTIWAFARKPTGSASPFARTWPAKRASFGSRPPEHSSYRASTSSVSASRPSTRCPSSSGRPDSRRQPRNLSSSFTPTGRPLPSARQQHKQALTRPRGTANST